MQERKTFSTPLSSSPVLLLSLVSSACYFNSIFGGFVFDDVSAIKDNKDLRAILNIQNKYLWCINEHITNDHTSIRSIRLIESFAPTWFSEGL